MCPGSNGLQVFKVAKPGNTCTCAAISAALQGGKGIKLMYGKFTGSCAKQIGHRETSVGRVLFHASVSS